MTYVRFPLSLQPIEDLLHETVRVWWNRFGPVFANETRKRRIQGLSVSFSKWHLDEVFLQVNGEQHNLWQAVDHEGEVLKPFITKQ